MVKSGTSKGNQMKYYENGYFIKLDTPGWYESVSEVLVSELQGHIVNALPFVDYTWEEYNGFSACRSKSFLQKGEQVVSMYSLLKGSGYNIDFSGSGEYLRDTICGIFNMEYNIEIYDYLCYIVYLDAITLNEDRHLRNISFVKSEGKIKTAPIYDNGLSLLSARDYYPRGVPDIDKVRSRSFSGKFEEQVKLFENPEIKIKYDSLIERLSFAENYPSKFASGKSISNLLRAIKILKLQLQRTEGILWTRV